MFLLHHNLDVFVCCRHSLHELSSVAFEILSSRLHDYYIYNDHLKNVPIRILSKLAEIHAFDSVSEEDLLSFIQSYLHCYVNSGTEERKLSGDFEELCEFFRESISTFDNEAIQVAYESFIQESKSIEELGQTLQKQNQMEILADDENEGNQEVLNVVSAQLLDHDHVRLTIHAYLTMLSKWILFAEIALPKRDHRTFKEFIGVHHTGDLLFSTDKRVAFVKRNGDVSYTNNCCFVCSREIDMECTHKYFSYQSHLFCVVPSVRRNMMMSDLGNSSDWEANNLAYILSMYDNSIGEWVDVGEFCSDNLLKEHMKNVSAEVTHYPEFLFDIHPQEECTWILASYEVPDSSVSEGKCVDSDGGKIAVKLFKLLNGEQLDTYKLVDVQSPFVLRNSGTRKSSIRSTCCKDKLYVQPVVLADDPAFEPEILYYSGPMYTYDILKDNWDTYPLINTTTKEKELNPLRGKREENSCNPDRDVRATNDGSINQKVFNVTFTSTIGSQRKECKESGSIAPSQVFMRFIIRFFHAKYCYTVPNYT